MATQKISKKSKTPKHKPSWLAYKGGTRAASNARRKAQSHANALARAQLHAELDRTGSRAKKAAIKQKKRDLWFLTHPVLA